MKRASVIVAFLFARRAAAFQVGSGVSHPCHELITRDAYLRVMAADAYAMVPPSGGDWLAVADKQLHAVGMLAMPDRTHEMVLFSLVNGVRWPDTHGGSLFDLEGVRSIHADPADQESHSLRALEDDGDAGNVAALDRTRTHIKAEIELARAALARPADQQIGTAGYYDDDYGKIDVAVWEPGFHLGIAAHAMQDSFAHTVRTSDLTQIVTVMNYIDAIEGTLDIARDGLPHSLAMDDCSDAATRPLTDAATTATSDLLRAAMAGDDIDAVLDTWMTYQPGCSLENGYCGSPWLPLARRNPSGPYVSCAVAAGGRSQAPGWTVALFAFALTWRRRRAKDRA